MRGTSWREIGPVGRGSFDLTPARREAPGVHMSADQFFGDLLEALAVHADPVRARSERAYLKSQREFLGVGVPTTRRVVREQLRRAGVESHDDVMATVEVCWEHVLFDSRRAAVEILVIGRRLLRPDDLDVIEAMMVDAETWAVLDPLATKVAGAIFASEPVRCAPVLDRWAADPESFWLRRASLLALLEPLRAGGGDWDRFCRYADAMLDEEEFFIRKAIGWVLRDTSRRRPEMVWEWVEPRLDRMSGVTRREALKYLR